MAKKKKQIPDAEWFVGRANYLSAQNKDRNEKYKKIDEMIDCEWELPEQLTQQDWIFKQVTTFFSQVVAAAVRIIADVRPKITITPAGGTPQGTVDGWERAIKWFLHSASRRRPTTIVGDISESAIRYSEVTQQVVFNPVQLESVKAAGGNENRFKALNRRGPFTVVGYHPAVVHARYSDVGAEEIVVVADKDPHDIIDLWGDKANELKEWLGEQAAPEDLVVTLVDYVSYDWRFVAAYTGVSTSVEIVPSGGKAFIIQEPERWKWPFLPWVSRYKGSTMEGNSGKQRRTLLDDAVKSDSFETMNRVKTLRYSEMIRYAGSAKKYFSSDDRESPGQSGAGADQTLHISTDEKIGDMNPPIPDPSMGTLDMELRMDAQKSTLSEILFGGDIPAGTAFSTINLVTHSALNVLKESTQLAQDSISDLGELFLLWAHYANKDLSGYGMDRDDRGTEYLIKAKEIHPEHLYIDTELSADLATDRQSRIMGATQAIQGGLLSRVTARDEMGVVDGKAEEIKIIKDQIMDALVGSEIENIRYLNSQQFMDTIKQQVMQDLMAAQQGQPQGQQAGPPPQGEGGAVPVPPGEGEGGGALTPETGIPPEAGGLGPSAAEANPSATFEGQTGQTRGGEEIA